jgi:transcriptional regulator with XRE-family HTH domain
MEHDTMARVDVNKLSDEQKIRILKKVIEKYGLSYVARELGVDRSTLYRYVSGKVKKVPDNVMAAAAEALDLVELSDVLYGFRTVDVNPTVALSVVTKALRDEGFRNFFLTLPYQYMGDYLRTTLTPISLARRT